MRSVGLDLGARQISYCEVEDGKVVDRTTVRSLSELESRLGSGRPQARVAFEACREGWHVHEVLQKWGQEPCMLDTTRIWQIGVGHHKRKNDAIDAEALARAVERQHLPAAHVLSPARQALRAELSVRGALVETRAQYITTIRGLARAAGTLLPACRTENFAKQLTESSLDPTTRTLVEPLTRALETLEQQLGVVEQRLIESVKQEPVAALLASAPGVGLIVAATFISVVDEAKRFRNAQQIGAYLGLVPSESTTGGTFRRKLGSITKQGNSHARAMLVQAAWSVLRMRDKNDPLHIWGTRLRETRGAKIAVVAVARKLAGVLWAMWRDGTTYDRAGQALAQARGVREHERSAGNQAAALERAAKKLQRTTSVQTAKTSEVRID